MCLSTGRTEEESSSCRACGFRRPGVQHCFFECDKTKNLFSVWTAVKVFSVKQFSVKQFSVQAVHLVETPDQERTTLWLAAMTCVLAVGPP